MAYDDFEDETIDRWTSVTTTGGSFAASEAAKKFGSWGGRMTTDGSNDSGQIRYTNTELTGNPINVYTWVRFTSASTLIEWFVRDAPEAACISFTTSGGNFVYSDKAGAHNFTEAPSVDTWYRWRATWDSTTDKVGYYLYDSAGGLLEDHTDLDQWDRGDANDVSMNVWDTTASTEYVDFDNTCYTDTSEPPPPPTGQFMVTQKYW